MEYLEQAVRDEASDIFFVAGGAASEKVDGRIRSMGEELVMAVAMPFSLRKASNSITPGFNSTPFFSINRSISSMRLARHC